MMALTVVGFLLQTAVICWLVYKVSSLQDDLATVRPSAEYYARKQEIADTLLTDMETLDRELIARAKKIGEKGVVASDWKGLAARVAALKQ